MIDVSEQHDSSWRVFRVVSTAASAEHWRIFFPTFRALPPVTQERVALLRMLNDYESMDAIGSRVSERTYWLNDDEVLLNEYKEIENATKDKNTASAASDETLSVLSIAAPSVGRQDHDA